MPVVASAAVRALTPSLKGNHSVGAGMPATLEIVCNDDTCELDMFELHYTYDMPDSVGLADFSCPYCGQTESLSEVEL